VDGGNKKLPAWLGQGPSEFRTVGRSSLLGKKKGRREAEKGRGGAASRWTSFAEENVRLKACITQRQGRYSRRAGEQQSLKPMVVHFQKEVGRGGLRVDQQGDCRTGRVKAHYGAKGKDGGVKGGCPGQSIS